MKNPRKEGPTHHADGGTTRPETPELEGRTPMPEELTGKASGTDDDLVALFDDQRGDHIADGFRGGSEDDPASPSDISNVRRSSMERPTE